eukprot:Gb_17186 [translate_table: standard]
MDGVLLGRRGQELICKRGSVKGISTPKTSEGGNSFGVTDLDAVLYGVWINPSPGYGGAFVNAISKILSNNDVVMSILLLIFAVVHRGMATFRDAGERLIGERAYRVLYAGLSLPLALSAVIYFINHRYDGVELWQVQSIPGLRHYVWVLSFISFFFLYPSTFNLLEVAAVDRPKIYLWETGIVRYLQTSADGWAGYLVYCPYTLDGKLHMMLTTSLVLIAHHIFGVWNGDRRMSTRFGEALDLVKKCTSIVPFAAILDGRQKLPKSYYKEFVRLPFFTIVALTLGVYFAHPFFREASYNLHW